MGAYEEILEQSELRCRYQAAPRRQPVLALLSRVLGRRNSAARLVVLEEPAVLRLDLVEQDPRQPAHQTWKNRARAVANTSPPASASRRPSTST